MWGWFIIVWICCVGSGMSVVDAGLEFLKEGFPTGADDESCWRRVVA